MPKTNSTISADAVDSAFVRRRIATLGLVLAGIGMAFVLMRLIVVLAVGRPSYLLKTSMVVHYLGILVCLAMWFLCRKGERRLSLCYAVELGGLFAACSFYGVMASGIPQAFRPEMTILLAFGLFLMAHAVHVPSSWRWTAILGAALAVPLFASAWVILTPMDPRIVAASASSSQSIQTTSGSIIGIGLASVITWWVVIVATASMASAVIYGLRREIHEAVQLGQYTLENRIGQGGMGVVYRARHAMLRRPTAIKLLARVEPGHQDLVRFEREVQATSRLTHPNIIPIHDFGRTPEGIFYYAMEYVEGPTLQQLVDVFGPVPPARVIHILSQVCGALAEAHGHGLIHRDVKPANIMLTTSQGAFDRPLVLDFGLVKELEGQDSGVTQTGTVAGTPLYMPPEVALRNEADARSDLYALGAVTYFLLAGKPVFDGSTAMAVCAKHAREEPKPPSEKLGRALPKDLESLVLDCLQKEPASRPESALALRDALDGCQDAGQWKHRDAQEWWDEYATTLARLRDEAQESVTGTGDTLVIDLADRQRNTWD